MNDTTLKPEADWHPKIKNIVYHGMDWLCPSFNQVLAQQLTSLYGNLTAENSIRNVTSIVQTGSLLVTYYDFNQDTIYTANARGSKERGPDNAYDRWISFDLFEGVVQKIHPQPFLILQTIRQNQCQKPLQWAKAKLVARYHLEFQTEPWIKLKSFNKEQNIF